MFASDAHQYSRLDYGFAQFMLERSKLAGDSAADFYKLLLNLSANQAAGHNCMLISAQQQSICMASGLSSYDQVTPLIVNKNRLYLHRYWFYEQRLAKQLIQLKQQKIETTLANNVLDRYFETAKDEVNLQKRAAEQAIKQGVTIITGGPGTGKTTTVVKILAIFLELAAEKLHIALAAPTGKAAMRLQESINKHKPSLPCKNELKDKIPDRVSTIHSLLGSNPPTPYFKHNSAAPLPYDIIVIDESSMVDLALMSKLVDAIKPNARLILLGDKDQLASVESGAVLSDLCLSLSEQTIELLKSHRFQGSIKLLAEAVNQQRADLAWNLLQQGHPEISMLTSDPIAYIVENYLEYLQLIADNAEFLEIYTCFSRFQVLCANQNGPNSVFDINFKVEQALNKLNKIQIGNKPWYHGRPVIVRQNQAELHLYNGDIGICLADPEQNGELRVFFIGADGKPNKQHPARLNICETVFAMTIHKSQGSEFENVLIILPERSNPILNKELLYTAITRAKNQVKIISQPDIFYKCIQQQTHRLSGLAETILHYEINNSEIDKKTV